jgi:putative tricarboxylic transport membrane protein
MEIIKYMGKGIGFYFLLAFMAAILAASVLIVRKSEKKIFTGRIIIPLFFIEFTVVFGILALNFPKARGDEVGASIVPFLWLICIFGLALYLLIRGITRQEEKDPEWGRVGKVFIFLGMTVAYLFIMQLIGYSLATLLYLICGMLFLSYRNWKVMITISGGWVLFSYFIFYRLLYVPLPRGLLIEWIFG